MNRSKINIQSFRLATLPVDSQYCIREHVDALHRGRPRQYRLPQHLSPNC